MSRLQPLPATTSNAHGLHGGLYGFQDSRSGHDEARHDHIFEGAGVVLKALLAGVECESEVAVPEVFGLREAGAENVRHNSRLRKQMLHAGCSKSPCCLAREQVRAHRSATAIDHLGELTATSQHSFRCVNASVAAGCKSPAQIASKSPSHTIRKHQPCNNTVLLSMRNPSYQADLAIDALDIDASGENVGDYQRLRQRRIVFIGHINHPGAA